MRTYHHSNGLLDGRRCDCLSAADSLEQLDRVGCQHIAEAELLSQRSVRLGCADHTEATVARRGASGGCRDRCRRFTCSRRCHLTRRLVDGESLARACEQRLESEHPQGRLAVSTAGLEVQRVRRTDDGEGAVRLSVEANTGREDGRCLADCDLANVAQLQACIRALATTGGGGADGRTPVQTLGRLTVEEQDESLHDLSGAILRVSIHDGSVLHHLQDAREVGGVLRIRGIAAGHGERALGEDALQCSLTRAEADHLRWQLRDRLATAREMRRRERDETTTIGAARRLDRRTHGGRGEHGGRVCTSVRVERGVCLRECVSLG